MGLTSAVLLAALLGAPPVEVSTLKGETLSGELSALSAAALTLKTADGEERTLPVSDLLAVEIKSAEPAQIDPAQPRVWLTDGSELAVKNLTTDAKGAALETARVGAVTVPLSAVQSVRMAPADPAVEAAWQELRAKKSKRDLIVIRKENKLDYLEGLIGSIDADHVKFQLGRDQIPVKREKVFGLVYARPEPPTARPAADVRLAGNDLLRVASLGTDGDAFQAKLLAGPQVTLPADAVRSLDFSRGKVRYLSQMEPDRVEYVPFFDREWKYRRDSNDEGKPLLLGGKKYARGLWIHSKTTLTYRLGGEYRRFEALMGIDENLSSEARHTWSNVHVTITGDGRPLLETDVKGADPPRPVELDVTGLRDLTITVDFGTPFNDVADHLDLADARVIK